MEERRQDLSKREHTRQLGGFFNIFVAREFLLQSSQSCGMFDRLQIFQQQNKTHLGKESGGE